MSDPVLVHIDHGVESWDGPVNDNMDKIDANFVRSTKSASHGQKTIFDHNEVLSATLFASATYTFAGLIPAGCYLYGITTFVQTAIIAPTTSFEIGDGVTADLFGHLVAIAAGTKTDLANHKSTWVPKLYLAATDVVLTSNGGNFAGGKVRATAHFLKLIAPTS